MSSNKTGGVVSLPSDVIDRRRTKEVKYKVGRPPLVRGHRSGKGRLVLSGVLLVVVGLDSWGVRRGREASGGRGHETAVGALSASPPAPNPPKSLPTPDLHENRTEVKGEPGDCLNSKTTPTPVLPGESRQSVVWIRVTEG